MSFHMSPEFAAEFDRQARADADRARPLRYPGSAHTPTPAVDLNGPATALTEALNSLGEAWEASRRRHPSQRPAEGLVDVADVDGTTRVPIVTVTAGTVLSCQAERPTADGDTQVDLHLHEPAGTLTGVLRIDAAALDALIYTLGDVRRDLDEDAHRDRLADLRQQGIDDVELGIRDELGGL